MTITMNDTSVTTFAQIEAFSAGTLQLEFTAKTTQDSYDWIVVTLRKFSYVKQQKPEKTLLKLYIQKVTGYSRSQVTRLICVFHDTGSIKRCRYLRHVFVSKYTHQDIVLLAKTDLLHDAPNGCAVKQILHREAYMYDHKEYIHLAGISVSHIYNLRTTHLYRSVNTHYEKTHKTAVSIGERRAPKPEGKPGYLRVDSIHQGDQLKEKGVYHINIIDETTQYEFVGSVPHITEEYLIPLLTQLIACFPFRIVEIHADNGSEYINAKVAALLDSLLIKLTKSRSRKTTDNALAECKNGCVVRKWIGYGFVLKKYYKEVNNFYFGSFNEYLNYHRPCGFAQTITAPNGKQKKHYPLQNYMTPFEKLKSINSVENYLKPGGTIQQLEIIASRHSDNEMATIVQKERDQLFEVIHQ